MKKLPLSALLLAGCGSVTVTSPVCSAGATRACNGASGCAGSQSCASDGSSWGACVCPEVCTPNATQSCVGPGACAGSQDCAPDGSAWGACTCAPVCTPNATQSCTGSGGCAGSQSCAPDGSAWSPCTCAPVCTAGATESCTGAGGCSGTATCTATGSAWGACQCAASTGEIAFTWTFNGGESCETAGVSYVKVAVGGNAVTFTCRDPSGHPGVTVVGLAAGATSYTLTGEDASQNPIYQATGSANVVGGSTTAITQDLAVIGNLANSAVTFDWTFGGQGCSAAGVSSVTVTITDPSNPSAPSQTAVPCTDASGVDEATYAGFAAGNYGFTFDAAGGAAGTATSYAAQGTVYVDGLNSVALHVDLPLTGATTTTGALAIDWTFGGNSCGAAGLDHIHVFLTDSAGNVVTDASGGTTDQTVLCSAAGAGVTYPNLNPGTYWLDVQGLASGAVAYDLVNYQVAILAGGQDTETLDVPPVQ